MTRVLVGLAVSLLLAHTFAGCAGEAGNEDLTPDAAMSLLAKARAAIEAVDSYSAQVVISFSQPDVGFQETQVEWQRPDRFRLAGVFAAQELRGHCADSDCETEVTPGGDETGYEAIVAGDRGYNRQCPAGDAPCDDWSESPRDDIYFPSPSPAYDPGWPIVGLETVVDPVLLGQEEIDGVPLVHVQGKLNVLRAIYEQERRGLKVMGTDKAGQECEAAPGQEERCRDLTIDEVMERQADDIRDQDENPALVGIWIGRDDFLMRRFAIIVPPGDSSGEDATTMTFSYSRFGQVEIRPPR